ncbi:hypothetical protein AV530_008600 [Patagioenas fasciata monilis]|uniref:Uncharacterized protein n=1 Tax=Patagioenas fasciata monilis TaxID=372326 RepID=A0A1V4JEW3_PATFA|nr:hypothetical protein AV530_008600 [Patagioenas fasciata monilis]
MGLNPARCCRLRYLHPQHPEIQIEFSPLLRIARWWGGGRRFPPTSIFRGITRLAALLHRLPDGGTTAGLLQGLEPSLPASLHPRSQPSAPTPRLREHRQHRGPWDTSLHPIPGALQPQPHR